MSGPEQPASDIFDMMQHDDGRARSLGVVRLDGLDRLAVVSVPAEEADDVAMIVAELNAAETLHETVPPPRGARPFAMYTRLVTRGTPGFRDTLLGYLDRYYGIQLDAHRPTSSTEGPASGTDG